MKKGYEEEQGEGEGVGWGRMRWGKSQGASIEKRSEEVEKVVETQEGVGEGAG